MNEFLRYMGIQINSEPQNPEQQNLLQIVKYKFSANKNNLSSVEQNILNNQKKYNSNDFSRLTQLCNESMPLEEIFKELPFPMKPNIEIVNEIKSQLNYLKSQRSNPNEYSITLGPSPNPNSTQQQPNPNSNNQSQISVSEIIIYGSFHQSLAWVSESTNRNTDFIINLLTIFLEFLNIPQIQGPSKSPILSHLNTIFCLSVQTFVHDESLPISDSFVAAVLGFLTQNYSIKENFTDVYNDFFSKVVKSAMPRSISHILRVTLQFIHEHRPFLPIEPKKDENAPEPSTPSESELSKKKIFSIGVLSPLIQNLDSNAIELICTASTTTTSHLEPIRELIDLLAVSLVEKIVGQTHNKIEIAADQNSDLSAPSIDDEYVFETQITDMKYNPTELSPLLDIIRAPSRDLTSYLPSKPIDNTTNLIVFMFSTINSWYLDSFLTIFTEKLQEHINTVHYLDLFAVMIYIFDKLTGKYLMATYSPFLISPVIFTSNYTIFTNDANATLNDFRYFTVQLILNNSQTLFCRLLNYASNKSPFLFAENLLRVLLNMSDYRLELFCSENIHRCLFESSYRLQQMYLKEPSNMTRLARITIFKFTFSIIEDSTAFLLSSSSQFFSNMIFKFLFEPSLTILFLNELKTGFVNSNITFTLPVFLQILPVFMNILEKVSSAQTYLNDERYTDLANQIIKCVSDSLTHNLSLIHSFVNIVPSILNYVSHNSSEPLLYQCFLLFSILSQSSNSFVFSPDMFRLFLKIIKKVEGNEPSLHTQLKFYSLLSGSNQSLENTLFFIRAPQFIALFLASFSQSKKLRRILEFFTNLCKYSPANSFACNKGDLDFLLLQILKYGGNRFVFNNCELYFSIDLNTNDLELIINLLSYIISVKTNVSIIDTMFKLITPSSSFFNKDVANSIFELMSNSIAAEINMMKPIFDMDMHKVICQINGIEEKEFNSHIAVSIWLKFDIPLIQMTSESLTIFSIDSLDGTVSFKVFMNNDSMFASVRNLNMLSEIVQQSEKKTYQTSGIIYEKVPSNEWALFTFVIHRKTDGTNVTIYKGNEYIGIMTFSTLLFPPNSKLSLCFGELLTESDQNKIDLKSTKSADNHFNSIERITPSTMNSSSTTFCYQTFALLGPFSMFETKDNNIEQLLTTLSSEQDFKELTHSYFTSSDLVTYHVNKNNIDFNKPTLEKKNRKKLIKKKKTANLEIESTFLSNFLSYDIFISNLFHFGNCFNDVLYSVYDLNYLVYNFQFFKPSDYGFSYQYLQILLSSLSSLVAAQEKFISVPILAKSLPIVFKGNLNYKLYTTLFTALSTFRHEPLITEFFESIIMNLELWSNADFASIQRITKHWTTSAYDSILADNSTPFKISQLLALFHIWFFCTSEAEEIENTDVETQTHFDLYERCLIHSFCTNHTDKEIQSTKTAFLNFIGFSLKSSITPENVYSIYYHLFKSEITEKKVLLLNLLDKIGPTIHSELPSLRLDFVKPLHFFFNTDDTDIILAAIMALYSMADNSDIHLLLCAASVQIILNSNYSQIFERLLEYVDDRPNLYSLICSLALSLSKEEQNKAIEVLDKINKSAAMSNKISHSSIWSIEPICLGLYCTNTALQYENITYENRHQKTAALQNARINLIIISEFLATQIMKFADVVGEFNGLLSVIYLLANDWKSAAYELQSEFTFALCKCIFVTNDENIINLQYRFIRSAFNSIFFFSMKFRNRCLFKEFTNSPFSAPISQVSRRMSEPAIPRTLSNYLNQQQAMNEMKKSKEKNDQISKVRANGIGHSMTIQRYSFDENHPLPSLQIAEFERSQYLNEAPPFKTFLSMINWASIPFQTTVFQPTFQMRITDDGTWVDDKLCLTLTSVIQSMREHHNSLQFYCDIVHFIRMKRNESDGHDLQTNLTVFSEIQEKIEILMTSIPPFDPKDIFHTIHSSVSSAQKMIYEGLSGINIKNDPIEDIELALDTLEQRQAMYREVIDIVESKFVFPRSPELLLKSKEITMKRDNCSCFDFCPYKFKPIIKPKSYKIWQLKKTYLRNGIAYSDVDIQTENLEFDSEQMTDLPISRKFTFVEPCLLIETTKVRKALCLISTKQFILLIRKNRNRYMDYNKRAPPIQSLHKIYLQRKLKRDYKIVNIDITKILNIFKRKRYQKDTAIELFLIDGQSFFLDFSPKTNHEILEAFSVHPLFGESNKIHKEEPLEYFNESKQTNTSLWVLGQISNFTYLMTLNTFSGRTFNDILQYPIMPTLTSDLKSIDRNLTFPSFYQQATQSTDESELEMEEFGDPVDLEIEEMFHTSPLPPATIDNYLVRIEPFTSIHLKMQSNQFINHNHMMNFFHSFNDELNHLYELPPEFYFSPEIFDNMNKINIEPINLNEKITSYEIVYKLRQLLESKDVSNNLHKWIDLIWGVKQKGELALKYRNYLHPFILEDVWSREACMLVKADDQVLSIITLYGTMPQQLFTELHPCKHENPAEIKEQHDTKKFHAVPIIFACRIADNGLLAIDSLGKLIVGEIKMSISDHIIKTTYTSPLTISPGMIVSPIEKGLLLLSTVNGTISLFQYGTIRNYRFFTPNFFEFTSQSSDHSQQPQKKKRERNRHHASTDDKINDIQSLPQNNFNTEVIVDSFIDSVDLIKDEDDEDIFDLDRDDKIISVSASSTFGEFLVVHETDDSLQSKEKTANPYLLNFSNYAYTNFDAVYSSQKYFLIVKDRTIINVYNTIKFPSLLGEILIVEDIIVHCQISQQFNIIAILTRNGFIHIHSLSTFQKTGVIQLTDQNSAKQIIITPRWGFIVVDYGSSKFSVFSVNGTLIKNEEISFLRNNSSQIVRWSAISSLKDFDYILFEDIKGNVGYFEAFNPCNSKILTKTNSGVCHMDYCRCEDCIFILNKQGQIIFIENPFQY